jgi:uncharacterized protein YbjT (DUF2867 family)
MLRLAALGTVGIRGLKLVVLLTGASGFIGRGLAQALAGAGHEVVHAVRDPAVASACDPTPRYVAANFTRDFEVSDWLPRLTCVDVVVNAVGILRERGSQTFEAIHLRAPRALFAACRVANVKVIQISALGADANAMSRYHKSKRTADEALFELCDAAVVVQPSLVYGPSGTSARLFTRLASLPLIPLPDGGEQRVQPIHIDDLVSALVALVEKDLYRKRRIPLVGPQPVTLREFVSGLRQGMGLDAGVFMPVPASVMNLAARLGERLPASLLDRESLQMLRRGNTADAEATRELLGRAPRPISAFITPHDADSVRVQAQLGWLLPMLRMTIAFVWIFTGIVSLGVYPADQSYALLARVGLTGWTASVALYGAALLDIALGIAIFIVRRRRFLWIAQAALILAYTVIITVKLPEFWLHPYGPILKNLPMLAVIWLLYELEKRQWTT